MEKRLNQEGITSIFWLFLFFIGLFFLFNNISGFREWNKAGELLGSKDRKIADLQQQKKALEQRKKYVESEDFVEKEARGKLGLGSPGQVRIVVPPGNPASAPAPQEEIPNWEKWLELFKLK